VILVWGLQARILYSNFVSFPTSSIDKLAPLQVITSIHAKYFTHELTRQHAPNGISWLSQSLFDAGVDLNPHQIETPLFVLKFPLSKVSPLAVDAIKGCFDGFPFSVSGPI